MPVPTSSSRPHDVHPPSASVESVESVESAVHCAIWGGVPCLSWCADAVGMISAQCRRGLTSLSSHVVLSVAAAPLWNISALFKLWIIFHQIVERLACHTSVFHVTTRLSHACAAESPLCAVTWVCWAAQCLMLKWRRITTTTRAAELYWWGALPVRS